MKPTLVIGALFPALFFCSGPALAQGGAAPSVAFPQVTGFPTPLQSASGRFSSLNPRNPRNCPYKQVTGRVVSARLIMVQQMNCGRPGHDNVLVNVQLKNPADAVQMVPGRRVVVAAKFKSAVEDRDPRFFAEFLIAEQAELVADEPRDRSAPPAQAFTSYMMCQPPELDSLARQLGNELCVQNTLAADLAKTGPALEAAARAPGKVSPEDPVSGDPNAISCRLDPKRSDAHLPAIACARNSYWAWYKAKWDDPLSPTPAPA
jgi:hypothetical protein